MSTVGIIAEYNPFHKGHAYQLEKAKELTGADHAVIVMSGNYVQRGTPAIIDKYTRAKHAVNNGASLVLELPVCYSTASAELFAYTAISLLNSLGVVDFLSFGCENDNLNDLKTIASILVTEPEEYKNQLKSYLSEGQTYPNARKQALYHLTKKESMADLLDTPNNILAIEYLKALYKTKSTIKPIPVKRMDEGYHSHDTNNGFASATAIRELLYHRDFAQFMKFIPENTSEIYQKIIHLIHINDFSQMLAYKLIYTKDFNRYHDVSEFLANRIRNCKDNFSDYSSFMELLLTKNETYTHISRSLLHILLELTKEDMADFQNNGLIFYANPLAFNQNSTTLLKEIKHHSSIPFIHRFGDYYKKQSGTVKNMLDINLKADTLYHYIFSSQNHLRLPNDFTISNAEKGFH